MKTILVDAVHTFVIKGVGIFKEMYDLLETFENKKIILTNANDEQFKTHGLDKMSYRVFTLKHNPDKVDPEYYRTFLEQYDLKSEDVVYFEHSIEAVESAKSVGIISYHYDPDKKDLNALKQFLVENL